MEYLERLFRDHPAKFVFASIVFASLIGSAFQEIGSTVTGALTSKGVSALSIIINWLLFVMIIGIVPFVADLWITRNRKKVKVQWGIVNDDYARIVVLNEEK